MCTAIIINKAAASIASIADPAYDGVFTSALMCDMICFEFPFPVIIIEGQMSSFHRSDIVEHFFGLYLLINLKKKAMGIVEAVFNFNGDLTLRLVSSFSKITKHFAS